MSTTYATLKDLIDREITPALDGVEPNFNTEDFVKALRDADLIVWHDIRQGFELISDEGGNTPGFWELVEQFDTEARSAFPR